jgi:chromosome segregation protein
LKLLRLELNGFKSFPKKTTLEFHEGITAIVGPNGCGKSNLVDAIRWVLGEQNPRLLRGERMDDAIFKGTTNRKPLGLAEVTISLSNERGELPIPYSEVSLTRRLHKSGESQYMVNKNQMRLKDITDLTSGTGIGLTEYSIIDQKLVDMILDESTSNRRELLEEAAGVATYKKKRHLSRKKLEAVESDLKRLGDIVVEVERNVGSLGRHVKKAKRYQMYRERQQELDIKLTSIRLSKLSSEEKEVSDQLEERDDRIREYRSRVEERTKLIADARELTGKLEEETRKKRIEIDASQARKNELDGDLRLARERQRLGRERMGYVGLEREELLKKSTALVEEKNRVEERMAEVEDERSRAEVKHVEQEKEVARLTEQLERKRELLVSTEEELEEDYRASLREEARKISLREEIGSLMKRKAELEPLLAGESDEMGRMESEGGCLSDEIVKLTEIVGSLQAELREKEQQHHELLVRKDSFTRIERESELALNNVNARLETAREKDGEEGLSSAVQSALELGKEMGKPVWTVSELLTIKSGTTDGLLRFYKTYKDCVVTEDLDTALAIVTALRERDLGAVSIIPLESAVTDPVQSLELDGVVRVSNLVECSDRFYSLRDHLFGKLLLVPVDADVRELVMLSRDGHVFLADDGSFIVRRGGVTGGRDVQKAGENLEELQAQGEQIMQKLSEANLELEEVESVIQEIKQGRTQIELNLEDHSSELRGKEKRAHQVSVELTTRQREQERLRAEHNSIVSTLEEKGALLRVTEETLGERAARLDELRERREELARGLEDLTGDERIENGLLSDRKIDVVALSSRLREVEILDRNIGDQLDRIGIELDSKDNEEKTLEERIEGLQVNIGDLENGLEAERSKIEVMTRIFDEEEDKLRKSRQEAEEIGAGVEDMRNTLEAVLQERNEFIVRKKELTITMESLVQRIKDEYEVTLDVDRIDGDDLGGINIEELESELVDIKRKIHYMGSVNMVALEEYETEKERHDFLISQRSDLLQSKEDLEKTIRKLNRVAKELFRETFGEVRKNFTRIFSTLFRGGDAGLELYDDLDPLESDIRIYVRPRGKKEQAIELLSGGERALAAIAFLFSLYLVKSSPFCIFDEVDAPLDDANISRFTAMLSEHTGKTQFVIITHNKRTMEAADYLYGVSMEEPGVSKVVSIKLGGNGNGRKKVEDTEEGVRIIDEAVI